MEEREVQAARARQSSLLLTPRPRSHSQDTPFLWKEPFRDPSHRSQDPGFVPWNRVSVENRTCVEGAMPFEWIASMRHCIAKLQATQAIQMCLGVLKHPEIYSLPMTTLTTNPNGTYYSSQELSTASNGTHKVFPLDIALVSLLKVRATQNDLNKGSRLHADILKQGLLGDNVFAGNILVNMYAKCGALAKARQLFDELYVRDVASWNAIIAAFAQHGHGEEALSCLTWMKHEGVSPSASTFASILKACGSIGAIKKGQEIHIEVIRMKLLQSGAIALGNALVDMYAKCNELAKAQQVFEELSIRNVITWNALITGHCQHGNGEEALSCFERMKREGVSPSAVTFACILKACGNTGSSKKGKEIHAEIATTGFLDKDAVLGNALVGMYAKCGALSNAQAVFDGLLARNVVSWNTLMEGYCQHGRVEEAYSCFEHMKAEGFSPDGVSFACMLGACGSIRAAEKGKTVHAEIVRKGLLGITPLGNALVDMYAKCGVLAMAQKVFDELPVRCVVSWTALITGYCQQGHDEAALIHFVDMKHEGLSPDAVTFGCILKACGSKGAVGMGEEVHVEILRKQLLEHNTVLSCALVDMYAKCGVLRMAQEVFDEISVRTVVSWTALIAGYSENGHGKNALYCFEQMKLEGFHPDAVTISCILKACSCVGAAEKGQMYFDSMSTNYGIIPTLIHQTCMVDLYSRAGHLDEAMAILKKMPSSDHLPAWLALMSACSKLGNVKLGRLAFEHVEQFVQ